MFWFRGTGWANGTAVDPRRCDADEEKPVESSVAALERSIADLSLRKFHASIFPGRTAAD
jgi:hypothetical protein